MGLKAPHIFTFLVSMIIVIMVVMVKFAGANVPFMKGQEVFWPMLIAYLLLAGGSLTRSL
jgi:hypothetical protein